MSQIDPQRVTPTSSGLPEAYAPGAAPIGNVGAPDPVHRPTGDHEEVYYEGSPLIRGSFGRVFLHALAGIAIISLIFFLPKMFATFSNYPHKALVYMILVILGVIVLLVPILAIKRLRYRISNYRIDFESGLLSKNIDTLELWHVEDIKFHQSLIDRVLGVGSITVLSHDDTTPQLVLHSIPKSRELFETLKQRIIAVKRGQGVLKVDSGT